MSKQRIVLVMGLFFLLIVPATMGETPSVRVTDRLVSGQVTLPDHSVAGFTVFEGEVFSVQDIGAVGYHFGLKPSILDGTVIRVEIFDITESDSGAETLNLLETIEVSKGLKALVGSTGQFAIKITDIRESEKPKPVEKIQACHSGSGPAFTVPVSSQLVSGVVDLPNGESAGFTEFDGGMFKVRDTQAGYYYGLSPYIMDKATGRVAVKVFDIAEPSPGVETLKYLESIELGTEIKVPAKSMKLQIEIIEIRDSGMSAQAFKAHVNDLMATVNEHAADKKPGIKAMCCVTCGTNKACGNCAASLSCGSCCLGVCCPPET